MADSDDLVACRTLYNRTKLVPREQLIQRPSVYAVMVHDGCALVLTTRHSGQYCLPGGGIEKGERTEEALQREVGEEVGIRVAVGDFLHFETDFFYYDPLEVAIHGFMFYYACTPLTFDLRPGADDEDADQALWLPLAELSEADFQTHGALTLRLLRAAAAGQSVQV